MILMKFEKEIKGESKIDGHVGWIDVDALQFGVGRSITQSGSSAARDTSNPTFSELTLSRTCDRASTDLFLQAVCGESLGKCEIHFIQTAGADKAPQVYLIYELSDVLVSQYSASSGGEKPNESIGLNFTKFQTQYNAYDGAKVASGAKKGYNLAVNKPGTF